MNPYKILLAGDPASFRPVVKNVIQEAGLVIMGEVSDSFGLVRFLERSYADLIILDISLPEAKAAGFLPKLKTNYPGVKVLVLVERISYEYLANALGAGVEGILEKGDVLSSLVVAIKTVGLGKHFFSSRLAGRVLRDRYYVGLGKKPLSSKEVEVLKLTAQGKSASEIAHELSVSIRTAQHYRHNIKNKLNLHNKEEWVRYAREKDYI